MTEGAPARVADLGAPLAPAGEATWNAIAALAEVVPIASWAVVGGQMVALHAAIAQVEPPRLTTDGDLVIDVRAHQRSAMTEVATALVRDGFEVELSPDGISRYRKGRAVIDLLAPEGLGSRPITTTPPGRAVQAPGTTQALQRAEPVLVRWATGDTTVRTPSLIGAVVAKAAAATEIAATDRTMVLKHQQDLVFLLGLIASTDLRATARELRQRDRRRIRAAVAPYVDDDRHPAWTAWAIPSDVRAAIRRLLGDPPP